MAMCPYLYIVTTQESECIKAWCQLWESNTATCGLVTRSVLAGREVARKEKAEANLEAELALIGGSLKQNERGTKR